MYLAPFSAIFQCAELMMFVNGFSDLKQSAKHNTVTQEPNCSLSVDSLVV